MMHQKGHSLKEDLRDDQKLLSRGFTGRPILSRLEVRDIRVAYLSRKCPRHLPTFLAFHSLRFLPNRPGLTRVMVAQEAVRRALATTDDDAPGVRNPPGLSEAGRVPFPPGVARKAGQGSGNHRD